MQLKNKFIKTIFLLIFLTCFLFNISQIYLYAAENIVFTNTTILNDFGIQISYDHLQDIYIFNKVAKNNDYIIVDNNGLCIYKYTIINISKKIYYNDQKIIIPEELIFSFYNLFFIPLNNKQIYDNWYNKYKNKIDENNKEKELNIKSEDSEKESKKEEKQKIDEVKKDDEKKSEKSYPDDSTQIKKEKDLFYSYAQAKMVDFKVISFIVVDAGHGGEDPGAVSSGIYEKDINLKAALELKKVLTTKFPYLPVYLTREKDIKLTLEERVKFANKFLSETKTGIFISLHANANPYSSKKSGIEVYYLDYDVVDEKIKDLVKYENKDAENSILSTIINRLLNEQLIFESSKLAFFCFNNIKENIKEITPSFVKGAPFYVLAYSEMPSILIEMGYMTNPNDLKLMLTASYLNSLAQSISKGIDQFIKEYTISEGFKKIQ